MEVHFFDKETSNSYRIRGTLTGLLMEVHFFDNKTKYR
jgi:hypothetical protein